MRLLDLDAPGEREHNLDVRQHCLLQLKGGRWYAKQTKGINRASSTLNWNVNEGLEDGLPLVLILSMSPILSALSMVSSTCLDAWRCKGLPLPGETSPSFFSLAATGPLVKPRPSLNLCYGEEEVYVANAADGEIVMVSNLLRVVAGDLEFREVVAVCSFLLVGRKTVRPVKVISTMVKKLPTVG